MGERAKDSKSAKRNIFSRGIRTSAGLHKKWGGGGGEGVLTLPVKASREPSNKKNSPAEGEGHVSKGVGKRKKVGKNTGEVSLDPKRGPKWSNITEVGKTTGGGIGME